MDVRLYYIWLQRVCGAANRLTDLLFDKFPSAAEIYECRDFSFLPKGYARYESRLCNKDLSESFEIYKSCINRGIRFVTYHDEDFPEALRNIPDPPVMLFYYGDISRLKNKQSVAMVGTRTCTEAGMEYAKTYAESFSKAGVTVISGLAKGIDSIANNAALLNGGVSVGVLGTPIDKVYPPENVRLFHAMYKNGVVISEYSPGADVGRFSFPARNRIISALSDCTLVVEAAEGSGALITAKRAIQQGKPVYFIAGRVTAMLEGAVSVSSPAEVLERLQLNDPTLRIPTTAYTVTKTKSYGRKITQPREIKNNETDELGLLKIISEGPVTASELSDKTGVSIDRIYELLTMLELDGAIISAAGGRYVKAGKQ